MDRVHLRNGQVDVRRQLFLAEGQSPRPVRELEARLLSYLARHPNRVVTYGELLQAVWGYRPEHPPAVVHTTLRRLRRVIGDPARSPRHIFNVRGEGFRFVPAPDPRPPEAQGAAALEAAADADPLIGRETALQALGEQLDVAPLVTVTGPGGTGKTRLARALMDERIAHFSGGLHFVELSTARTLLQACAALATALGVPLSRAAPLDALAATLSGRGRVLVILDNVEQIAEQIAGAVATWAASLRDGGRLLLTSRLPLGLDAEAVFPLSPLAPPSPSATLEGIAASPAVRLFLRRARALQPELALDPGEARALAALMRDLDGLPLAIELAAARARTRSVDEIRAHLTRLRRRRSGEGPARHSSLQAVLAWSWELLDADQRAALSQAACFEGGFTLRAAEATLSLPGDADVEDVLDELIDHSLLSVSGQPPRLRMLYAVQQLLQADHPAPPEAWDRLAAHFSALGDPARLSAPRPLAGLQRHAAAVRAERANLRAGLERGGGEDAARCALALLAVFSMESADETGQIIARALSLEGLSDHSRAWLLYRRYEQAYHRPDAAAEAARREAAALAEALGDERLHLDLGERHAVALGATDPTAAEALLTELIARAERAGMPIKAAKLRSGLAILCKTLGRMEDNIALLQQALATYQAQPSPAMDHGLALARLGSSSMVLGRLAQARGYFTAALELLRPLPDAGSFVAGTLLDFAPLLDDAAEQLALMEEAEKHARRVGNRTNTALALASQGMVLQELDRAVEAQARARRGLQLAEQLGDTYKTVIVGIAQYCLASACWRLGQREEAEARLSAAHEAAAQARYAQMTAEIQRVHARLLVESGEAEAALAQIRPSVAAYRELQAATELAEALWVQGEAEALAGRDPHTAYAEAQQLAAAQGVSAAGALGRRLARAGYPLAAVPRAEE